MMPVFLLIVAAVLATAGARDIYGIVPLIPTSSFLDEQREIFRAEFQPVEVFTGLPDETYAALVDVLAQTPGEDILVAIVTAGPISWYAASLELLLDAGAAVLTVGQRVAFSGLELNASRQLWWDFDIIEETSAELIAAEVCRQTGPGFKHSVMNVYGAEVFDRRVDAIGPWLEANCDAEVVTKHVVRSPTWDVAVARSEAAKLLSVDPAITTIFSCNNEMLRGVFAAVGERISPQKAGKLFVTGYNAPDFDDIQTEGWVLAAGALGSEYLRSLWTIMNVIDDENIATTAELSASLKTERTSTTLEGTARYFDARGYTKSVLLRAYDVDVRPPSRGGEAPLVVNVGLRSVVVDEIDTAKGEFTATMWIEAAWHDPRLTYDETIAPGPLRVGADEVWTPSFHAANTMTPEELQLIKRLPVSVASDGTVVARWRVGGEFLCEMNIRSYPYDGHTCAIELAAGATTDEVSLVADLGFEVADGGPEGWYQPRTARGPRPYVGAWSDVDRCGDTCAGGDEPRVSYEIRLERAAEYIERSFVLVGWAFNIIAFGAFWMDDVKSHGMDRGGLSLAGIVASSFMLYEAKETEEYTWLDSYFSVMLTFQFLSFVLVVVSSRWERYDEDGGALKLQTLRRTRTTRSLELSPAYRRVFWLHRHFFGGADVPPVDLAVRRGLVPLFLLLQMGLCYYPFRGPGAIVGHRDAPLGGSLFFLNVGCLLWYAGLVGAGVAFGIGFEGGGASAFRLSFSKSLSPPATPAGA